MCGRFTLNQTAATLAQAFELEAVPDLTAQYNVAPTQMVATVVQKSESDKRQFQQLRWGLIPSWAKDPGIGAKLINARAETVAEKPSFRSAFKHRRCLVLADGFYEWHQKQGKKQPFYFRLQNGQPFAFAGLWEKWQSPEGEEINSCTILTTAANEVLQPIHDRMPVILAQEDYNLWLDPQQQKPEVLQPLLRSYPAAAMSSYAVSTLVNKPQHNTPECILPISENNP
ncbi:MULTISPECIES: SOS response-associated peptidase [Calothrix]|uniref:Abasic site processing protein n=2 Tax=Calothrix TaxID=1186 RepID=A0ABR8AB90_9CYAN|nr:MULTISPECIES: SOS response-associated peptidase [Calothrix]MBD2196695.1 SOS response-associated peptidase [Calothrix parietina FACHB-288]MBD2224208.1 SOS response-associated peptidase [Calothrix anomala FACHB-343]